MNFQQVKRLKVGDVVKFHAPVNDDEVMERFVVKEIRDDRVMVEMVCDMSIRPTFVYMEADLIKEG